MRGEIATGGAIASPARSASLTAGVRPRQSPSVRARTDQKKKSRWGWGTFLLLLGAVYLFRSLVVSIFSIPSGSMLPTLYIGDYVLVAKWPYGYGRVSFLFGIVPIEGRIAGRLPERGDIAVFRGPAGNDVIKRVIGLPGDVVRVEGGRVHLNGRPLMVRREGKILLPVTSNSPCRLLGVTRAAPCPVDALREQSPDGAGYQVIDQGNMPALDEAGSTTVPEGRLFVMGDNRDDSGDSRITPALGGTGLVPVDNLVGKALVTVWSTDGSAEWLKPWTWISAARFERIGQRP